MYVMLFPFKSIDVIIYPIVEGKTDKLELLSMFHENFFFTVTVNSKWTYIQINKMHLREKMICIILIIYYVPLLSL